MNLEGCELLEIFEEIFIFLNLKKLNLVWNDLRNLLKIFLNFDKLEEINLMVNKLIEKLINYLNFISLRILIINLNYFKKILESIFELI